jgi:hypothetical protein
MWIVYQKKDRRVVGLTAINDPDFDKESAVGEIVKGLLNGGTAEKYDAVQVKDPDQALAFLGRPFDHIVIGESGKGKAQASIETPKVFHLLIQSDAPDVHPVDGIPEIKADGTSFTTITVQKVDDRGEPQKSRTDNDELHLRTTAGTLQSAEGKDITAVKLKQGQAAFRLQSEKARRVATVSLFNADANVQDGAIRVEFI